MTWLLLIVIHDLILLGLTIKAIQWLENRKYRNSNALRESIPSQMGKAGKIIIKSEDEKNKFIAKQDELRKLYNLKRLEEKKRKGT